MSAESPYTATRIRAAAGWGPVARVTQEAA